LYSEYENKNNQGDIIMSKFEEMNQIQDVIVNKEIDAYLKKNGFELYESNSSCSEERELRRVYYTRGLVTYVSAMEERLYVFREDDVSAFMWDRFYDYKEDTTESIENFRSFMDNIYQEIF